MVIFSVSSSGILMPKTFSNSIISSTVSRESAPRSFVKLFSGVTSAASTLNFSAMMDCTFSKISDIVYCFKNRLQKYIFFSYCQKNQITERMAVIHVIRSRKTDCGKVFGRLVQQKTDKERTSKRFSLYNKFQKNVICRKIEENNLQELSGALVLASCVSSEDTCRGELAEFMTDHIFSNIDRNELIAVMHSDSQTDEVGRDHRGARPGLDSAFLAGFLSGNHTLFQFVMNIRTFF